ncbi:MAG: helix-turn-helix domain-containing protein [Chitinophagaceae bacterium]
MSSKITFLVLPNTNLLDLGGASQVFYEAKDQGLDIAINFCSSETSIVTAPGISLGNVEPYKKQKLNKGDYLIILSADYKYIFSKQFKPDKALLKWLVDLKVKGVILCAICTGAFLLGKAGLLDGIKCTTHWKRTAELQSNFPKAKVQQNIIFTEDHGIYTSAGANSAIDLALHILASMKDDFFAHKIARELVVYNRRSGNEAQQSIYLNNRHHIHNGIHKVQDYLEENLNKKNSLPELAELANMSHRNFCRIFKKETSLTVIEYVNILRKERIKKLLNNPDLSRSQIARQCGLRSERQVSRIIKKN